MHDVSLLVFKLTNLGMKMLAHRVRRIQRIRQISVLTRVDRFPILFVPLTLPFRSSAADYLNMTVFDDD